MWMEGILLDMKIAADGSADVVPQELRVSLDDGSIHLKCAGLFSMSMSESEFENLVECVGVLQKCGYDDGEE